MKRRKKRRIRIFISIILLAIITGVVYYSIFKISNNNIDSLLKKHGYSTVDISSLTKKLSDEDLNYLLTISYDENIVNIIENKDYVNAKLKDYINYLNDNNVDANDAVMLVNNNITIPYDENIPKLIEEKYYKKDNLERYLAYAKKHTDMTMKDIISHINSNLDHEYYSTNYEVDFSKGTLILVNKYYKLDKDYEPTNMVTVDSKYNGNNQQMQKEAYEAYKLLFEAISKENLILQIRTAYRSYGFQSYLYNDYVNTDGVALADTYSARPGHSEHHTGLAMDFGTPTCKTFADFEHTKQFAWLKDNSYKYGYILRYPEGKENLTGYQYEPWHYRYVGVEVATKIYNEDITFEEYYEYYLK